MCLVQVPQGEEEST
jgi:hypothetical protein